MFVRIWMMAGILSVTAFWSAEAFVVDDTPAPKKKTDSVPKDAKDSAAAKKALTQFHRSAVQAFIETPGFGHNRMPPMLRVIEDIRVEWTSQEVDDEKSQITVPDLAKAHRERIADYKKDSWSRLKLPGILEVNSIEAGGVKQTWRLHRIDLVAIVDHDEPIVYITPVPAVQAGPMGAPGIPLQGQVALQRTPLEALAASKGKDNAAANHREPNQLELAALDRFRDGEDVVVRSKGNVLQLIGALRATKQCLECHKSAKEGDLFGAFSYTLKKTPG